MGLLYQSRSYHSFTVIKACPSNVIALEDAILDVHVYQTNEADDFEEFTNGSRGEGDEVMAASVCELPSQALEGVWDR